MTIQLKFAPCSGYLATLWKGINSNKHVHASASSLNVKQNDNIGNISWPNV